MKWVPNILNQVNSSCHGKLKLKITNPLPRCTCLILPAYLISFSLASSCFLLLSQDKIKSSNMNSPINKQARHEQNGLQIISP